MKAYLIALSLLLFAGCSDQDDSRNDPIPAPMFRIGSSLDEIESLLSRPEYEHVSYGFRTRDVPEPSSESESKRLWQIRLNIETGGERFVLEFNWEKVLIQIARVESLYALPSDYDDPWKLSFTTAIGDTLEKRESASERLDVRTGMSIEEVESLIAALGIGEGIGRQSGQPSEEMPEYLIERSWWTRLTWEKDPHHSYVLDFNNNGKLIRIAQIATLYPAKKLEPFDF